MLLGELVGIGRHFFGQNVGVELFLHGLDSLFGPIKFRAVHQQGVDAVGGVQGENQPQVAAQAVTRHMEGARPDRIHQPQHVFDHLVGVEFGGVVFGVAVAAIIHEDDAEDVFELGKERPPLRRDGTQ